MNLLSRRTFAATVAVFVPSAAAPAVHAATCTWLGAGLNTQWSTAANWTGCGATQVPVDGDSLVFPLVAVQRTSVNDLTGLDLVQIQFTGPSYVVSGNAVTLSGGMVANVPTGAPNDTDPSFAPALTLTASAQTIQCTGARSLSLLGTLNLAGFGLTFDATCPIALQGATSGAGGISKVGPGTLVLTSTNTYSGTTTVNDGRLILNVGGGLGAQGAGNGTVVNSGATLQLAPVTVVNEQLTLNGPGFTGLGAVLAGGDAIWNGPVVLGTAASINVATDITFTVNGSTSGSGLTKVGAGTVVFATANTYAGVTLVNAGTLEIRNPLALGAAGAGNGTSVEPNGRLLIGTAMTVVNEALTLSGSGIGGVGALATTTGSNTWNGNITLQTDSTIETAAGSTLGLPATTNGGGGLTKAGAGVMVLAGANTYTGTTTVGSGALRIGSNGALGGGVGTSVVAGAALEIQGGVSVNEPLTLNGTGVGGGGAMRNVFGNNTWAGPITLATPASIGIDAAGTTLTLTGAASGSFGVTKVGAGTLEMSATNTYTGSTVINQGVLLVTGSIGPATISTGARLEGDGTVGAITLAAGGTLAPDGTLTAASLLWNGGGAVEMRIGGVPGPGSDRLQLSGAMQKGSGSAPRLYRFFGDGSGGAPVPGQTYVLANYASTDFVDADLSYIWGGGPPSVLDGDFIVAPTQLEFVAIALALFRNGFENP